IALDLLTELGDEPRHADWACIPPMSRILNSSQLNFLVRRRDLRPPGLKRTLALGRRQFADFLDEGRERRFGIGSEREVHVRVPAEVVDVAALEQMLGADADGLATAGPGRTRLSRHIV